MDEKENLLSNENNLTAITDEDMSLFQIYCVCGGNLALMFIFNCSFALTQPLSTKLGFSSTVCQLMSAFGPISGAVIQPLIGIWSDNVNSKYGKRRPFIIAGQIGADIGLLLQVIVFQYLSQYDNLLALRRALFVIGVIIFNASAQFPARAIIADVVPKHQQVLANAVATQVGAIAAVSCNLIGFLLNFIDSKSSYLSNSVFIPFVAIVISSLGSLASCLASHEEPSTKSSSGVSRLKETWIVFRHIDKSFIIAVVALFFSTAATFPFQYNVTSYFAKDIYEAKDSSSKEYDEGVGYGMLANAFVYIITYFCGMLVNPIVKRWGYKVPYFVSHVILIGSLFGAMFLHGKKNLWISLSLLSLIGLSQAALNSIPYTVASLSVSKEQMGSIMGILNIFLVCGQFVTQDIICPLVVNIPIINGRIGPVIAVGIPFAIAAIIISFFITVPKHPAQATEPSSVSDIVTYETLQ